MNNNVLETQIVQRAWDKRWEKLIKIVDYENSYTYRNENGASMTLVPEKWICVDVFDFIIQEV